MKELLETNWQIMWDEAKKIQRFYPDVVRPRKPFHENSQEFINKILKCKGWTRVESVENKWWNFPLMVKGKPTHVGCELAPKTIEILKKIEGPFNCGFSLLLPKGFIEPHVDPKKDGGSSTDKTCHLGLRCPPHCYLIQGKNAYEEKDGKFLEFDATKTHSAVNMSDEPRVILYVTFSF
jgi:aspartyl/asparaginyl beta-hydroxylase (cupin superfamily)